MPGPSKLSFAMRFCYQNQFHLSFFTAQGRPPGVRPLKDGKLLCLAMLRHFGSLWGHNAASRWDKINFLEYWHCLPPLPHKMIAQTGLCFTHQTPSCLGMATPCKAAHRPTPSEAGMHCHPPLLSEVWFLITHMSFQGFEMLSMHENSSWKYRDESAVFLQGIYKIWLCFINAIWTGFQFQNKTKKSYSETLHPHPLIKKPLSKQESRLLFKNKFYHG